MKRLKVKNLILFSLVLFLTVFLLLINLAVKGVVVFNGLSVNTNQHLIYQTITLLITGVFLWVLYLSRRETFFTYFRKGELSAPIKPAPLLAINPKSHENWWHFGRNFMVVISLVTAVTIYFQLVHDQPFSFSNLLVVLPFVLVFSAVNAFVEESITRLGVVVAFSGLLADKNIAYISAALFGIVHYWGNPGGIMGVVLAAFLGWFLCKSILETKGLFWAWSIHFLQDVIIFSVLLSD